MLLNFKILHYKCLGKISTNLSVAKHLNLVICIVQNLSTFFFISYNL